MPGFVPGIHVLRPANEGVDGQDKPSHDGSAEILAKTAQFAHPRTYRADLSRRSFSEGGSFREGASEGGLTSRRPLLYMPRVREIGRSAVRDPVAG